MRSRVAREGSAAEIASFAERAGAEIGEATALTNGLLALIRSVLLSLRERVAYTHAG